MRKIFIILVFIFTCVPLFSQDIIIPRTKNTSESEFSDIKTACHTPGFDGFIDKNPHIRQTKHHEY